MIGAEKTVGSNLGRGAAGPFGENSAVVRIIKLVRAVGVVIKLIRAVELIERLRYQGSGY